jgi:hypothetical protein
MARTWHGLQERKGRRVHPFWTRPYSGRLHRKVEAIILEMGEAGVIDNNLQPYLTERPDPSQYNNLAIAPRLGLGGRPCRRREQRSLVWSRRLPALVVSDAGIAQAAPDAPGLRRHCFSYASAHRRYRCRDLRARLELDF